jgi:transcriptional regulator GlxA family with amidase domain
MNEMSSDRVGAQLAAREYSQLLFVEVLRAHLSQEEVLPPGRLRALADGRISPALKLMHSAPDRAWHLDELSKSAGMSRTTFAMLFKSVVGVPPLTYLHEWRMCLAQRALRTGVAPMAELAATLGYASESSFSTAFKRSNGIAPRHYRDRERGAANAAPCA